MRRFILTLILIYLIIPIPIFANCSQEGFTVIYVNGILTDEESAKKNTEALKTEFNRKGDRTNVVFRLGYNPSHLAGLGDAVQVASQMLGSSMSDFDLKTILMEIHSEITTQKILLVGHSQGTFYTNEMYNYLTTNGVPKESIVVYNIATPASFVASDGKYLTSGNDNLVNTVREWAAAVNAPQPLPANILLPLSLDSNDELFRGHAFAREYLAKGSGFIISDINNLLDGLSVQDNSEVDNSAGCYEPPTDTLSYRMQEFGFAVADPLALTVRNTAVVTGSAIATVVSGAVSGVASVISVFGNALSGMDLFDSLNEFDLLARNTAIVGDVFEESVPEIVEPETAVSDPLAGAEDVIIIEPQEKVITEEYQDEASVEEVVEIKEEKKSDTYEWGPPSISTPYVGFGGGGGSSSAVLAVFGEGVVDDEVIADVVLPAVSDFIVPQCAYSLSSSGCLLSSSDVTLSWTSTSTDVLYYGIVIDGVVVATTTATSTNLTVADGSSATLSIVVYDSALNSATSSSQTVEVFSRPVVINEVAWAGTNASPSDEWIELFNPTSKDINLSDWVLSAEDGAPYINLEGTISAGGYYLIERSDDDMTVSDITADLAVAFSGIGGSSGLSNNGEHLLLEYVSQVVGQATSTIDETPVIDDVAGCGFLKWCGGDNNLKRTMERISSNVSGANRENWGSSLGEFILNGEDANGVQIKGTPRQENGAPHLIGQGGLLAENKTLNKAGSPYLIVRSGLNILSGVTLTIDPGVVVKFVVPNEPSLLVNGTLITNGTENEPVVFTAFADDEYGGDMNGDSSSTTPTPASWKRIIFNPSSVNSSLLNTVIRYGGRSNNMTRRAMVVVDSTDVSFDNVVIEYGEKHGLYLSNSTSQITNSVFRYNNTDSDAVGMYVIGGAPTISDSTFEANRYGLYVVGAPSINVTSNVFTDNSSGAVYVFGGLGSFSANAGTGNALNAIIMTGNITGVDTGTTTLLVNPLPYLIQGSVNIVANSTLAFTNGVVVKAHYNTGSLAGRIVVKSGGELFYDGSSANDVVFTSMHDDTVGGVVDTATTSPNPRDWYGIEVEDGGVVNMSGFTLKYGGGSFHQSGDNKGGIKIVGGTATSTIANALFENNYQFGIRLSGGASVAITDSEFNNHTVGKLGAASAIYLSDSSASLQNVAFANNELDIKSIGNSTVSCIGCGALLTDPANLFD